MNVSDIQILLVDDHKVLREGLRSLIEIEADLKVIGEASTGQQALEMVRSLEPDVIVMDLGLPDMNGIQVIETIRNLAIDVRIVVLSMHTRQEFVLRAIEAGSDGYVPKSATHTSLLAAIRVVHSGERYLHPLAASALIESITDRQTEAQLFNELTPREQEAIRLSAMGYTSREIGEKLSISPKTVETYRQRGFEKLGIETRADLVRFALQAGLLDHLKDS